MKRYIVILTLLLLTALPAMAIGDADSMYYHFDEVEITASMKSSAALRSRASVTALNMQRLEEQGVSSIKDISLVAPNFYQPDYGSSITSSIYIRGFGSRIDQPVLGATIDEVPIMNKNAYDFSFYDIRNVELLRGPQGTLYGRNTSGGVMNITTLSPLNWQGLRAMAEYSTVSSYRASLSYYARPEEYFGVSAAVAFNHDGGFFRNTYTDTMCDKGNDISARLRFVWLLNGRWSIDNSLSAGYTNEGGYAYHHYDAANGSYAPIAYNDPSGYKRWTLNEGLVAKYEGRNIRLSSITSYQLLDDAMTLDQDFTPRSMFTMQQLQREHTITEEVIIRNADSRSRWQWICGLFGFAKWLNLSSPVRFKEDGINDLILGNINDGIHSVFPDNNMLFGCDNFVISSDFKIPTYGVALYHQSTLNLGRWSLVAGLRFDYENSSMRYFSHTTIPYRFDLTMSRFEELYSEFKGHETQHFFEILPKLSVEYSTSVGEIYATITRGYKSGGYNTQIFSDILQSKMMNDMMDALGIELDSAVGTTTYDSAEATRYKPETSWNFEIGTHITPTAGLNIDAAIYWIECFNQQVTVLPQGNNTGRMMSNAARAYSIGAELSASYCYRGLTLRGDYGYTNARFRSYDDGTAIYDGNRLPYAPTNTVSLQAAYSWDIDNPALHQVTLMADWRGIGSIYWNEANTLCQPFYSLLGAQLMLRMKGVDVTLWVRNITNTQYDVFYFKSVGEEFFSKGAPLHAGIRLNLNI